MSVEVEKGPSGELWVTARADGAEVGAYLPERSRPGDGELSLFWCGDTSRTRFRTAVERMEKFFLEHGGYVDETLLAFGLSEEIVGPLKLTAEDVRSEPMMNRPPRGLGTYLTETSPLGYSEAYRANFEGSLGYISLWANVFERPDNRGLKFASENIGVCTSPALFDGPARGIIKDTILDTQKLGQNTVDVLLDEVTQTVKKFL